MLISFNSSIAQPTWQIQLHRHNYCVWVGLCLCMCDTKSEISILFHIIKAILHCRITE